jgi:hypothetical protein
MRIIKESDVIGRTVDGQTIVADGGRVAQAEGELAGTAYSSLGRGISRETYWNNENERVASPEDGLRVSKEKRLKALEGDRTHFSAPHYRYDTPRSTEQRNASRRADGVRLTYIAFSEELPQHVSLDSVQRIASRIDSSGLSPYGGLRLVGFVAILHELGVSSEELFLNEPEDVFPDGIYAVFEEHFSTAQMGEQAILNRAIQLLAGVER